MRLVRVIARLVTVRRGCADDGSTVVRVHHQVYLVFIAFVCGCKVVAFLVRIGELAHTVLVKVSSLEYVVAFVPLAGSLLSGVLGSFLGVSESSRLPRVFRIPFLHRLGSILAGSVLASFVPILLHLVPCAQAIGLRRRQARLRDFVAGRGCTARSLRGSAGPVNGHGSVRNTRLRSPTDPVQEVDLLLRRRRNLHQAPVRLRHPTTVSHTILCPILPSNERHVLLLISAAIALKVHLVIKLILLKNLARSYSLFFFIGLDSQSCTLDFVLDLFELCLLDGVLLLPPTLVQALVVRRLNNLLRPSVQ